MNRHLSWAPLHACLNYVCVLYNLSKAPSPFVLDYFLVSLVRITTHCVLHHGWVQPKTPHHQWRQQWPEHFPKENRGSSCSVSRLRVVIGYYTTSMIRAVHMILW